MKANWAIIPDIKNIKESLALAEKYDAAFEYNDFFWPSVYEDKDEVEKRIRFYRKLPRFGAAHTIHGVFYDVAATSMDSVIRKRSRELMEYSMSVAEELACKGVVFHSGLIGGFEMDNYIQSWVEGTSEVLKNLAGAHPGVDIYMENTFELKPDAFLRLMKECEDTPQIKLCLDYGHAILTPTSVSEWVEAFNPYLGHVHINDNDLMNDLHCPPGEGAMNFEEFKTLMGDCTSKDINFLIEVNGIPNQAKGLKYLGNL